MAEYKTVKGFNIETLSSDPSNLSEGQIWYNSTSNDIKGYADSAGAWATGTALDTAHGLALELGTSTAAIVVAGNGPSDAYINTSSEWDGSSWTAGGSLTRSPPLGTSGQLGFGTQTTATACGGHQSGPLVSFPTLVEEYDGTSWTAVTAMSNGRNDGCGAGTRTAGLVYCGTTPGGTGTTVEEYDGTSWTAGGAINNGRPRPMGSTCGTQTAALAIGGDGQTTKIEEYNGVGWTEVTAIPTASTNGGCSGIQTAALSFAGGPSTAGATATFSYDGTNWTSVAALTTGRSYVNALGTASAAKLCGGGYPFNSPVMLYVEDWTSGVKTVTFTDS